MSDADEVVSTAVFAALQAELTRVRDSVVTGWQNYHTWSLWFHGLQVGALGWILVQGVRPPNVRALAMFAIVLNVVTLYAALRVRSFVTLQTDRADAVCRRMAERTRLAGLDIEITSGFPGRLFLLSGSITVAVCAIAIVICVCLIMLPDSVLSHTRERGPV